MAEKGPGVVGATGAVTSEVIKGTTGWGVLGTAVGVAGGALLGGGRASRTILATTFAAVGAAVGGAFGALRGTAKGIDRAEAASQAAEAQRMAMNAQTAYDKGREAGAQEVVSHIQQQQQAAMMAQQEPAAAPGSFASRETAPGASKTDTLAAARAAAPQERGLV